MTPAATSNTSLSPVPPPLSAQTADEWNDWVRKKLFDANVLGTLDYTSAKPSYELRKDQIKAYEIIVEAAGPTYGPKIRAQFAFPTSGPKEAWEWLQTTLLKSEARAIHVASELRRPFVASKRTLGEHGSRYNKLLLELAGMKKGWSDESAIDEFIRTLPIGDFPVLQGWIGYAKNIHKEWDPFYESYQDAIEWGRTPNSAAKTSDVALAATSVPATSTPATSTPATPTSSVAPAKPDKPKTGQQAFLDAGLQYDPEQPLSILRHFGYNLPVNDPAQIISTLKIRYCPVHRTIDHEGGPSCKKTPTPAKGKTAVHKKGTAAAKPNPAPADPSPKETKSEGKEACDQSTLAGVLE